MKSFVYFFGVLSNQTFQILIQIYTKIVSFNDNILVYCKFSMHIALDIAIQCRENQNIINIKNYTVDQH